MKHNTRHTLPQTFNMTIKNIKYNIHDKYWNAVQKICRLQMSSQFVCFFWLFYWSLAFFSRKTVQNLHHADVVAAAAADDCPTRFIRLLLLLNTKKKWNRLIKSILMAQVRFPLIWNWLWYDMVNSVESPEFVRIVI